MRLGTKHQNPFQVVRYDFSGGLNTSVSVDGIAENQLAIASNVEVDHATGKLRTVAGTRVLRNIENLFAAMYDAINKVLLLVKTDKTVYLFNPETKEISGVLGILSGDLYPISASWEDGLLIASGGKLQYYNGKTLKTIETSPTATSVYVRAGRVLVSDESSVHYSSVGDEETWDEDTDDESSGLFVEAGYKDGGKLLAMVNLSTDVLLIKSNRHVYRLIGEFPNWQIVEVSRNVDVSGRRGICSIADSVFILGRYEVQNLQTTNAYGDVKPQNVATLIGREIQNLPEDSLLRYIPPLNQIWAISGTTALVLDVVTNSWYKRQFNSQVIDVIAAGNEVFVIKSDGVTQLDANIFYDANQPLYWKIQCQRLISHYDYLLKRVEVNFSPLNEILYEGQVRAGSVVVNFPIETLIRSEGMRKASHSRFFSVSEKIYENLELIYDNPTPICPISVVLAENRNVFRSKALDVIGRGTKGGMILNSITLDLVEV